MDEMLEKLRLHGADEMVCKVWTEAMKTALPVVANVHALNGPETLLYAKLLIAMSVADTITEGFITRFRQTTDK